MEEEMTTAANLGGSQVLPDDERSWYSSYRNRSSDGAIPWGRH